MDKERARAIYRGLLQQELSAEPEMNERSFDRAVQRARKANEDFIARQIRPEDHIAATTMRNEFENVASELGGALSIPAATASRPENGRSLFTAGLLTGIGMALMAGYFAYSLGYLTYGNPVTPSEQELHRMLAGSRLRE